LYNDGCIKDCMEKNLKDDAGEILRVHSQGDCDNVTTDDNEDAYLSSNVLLDVNHGDPLCSRLLHQGKCHVIPVIAPEKDSIIAPPSTPPAIFRFGVIMATLKKLFFFIMPYRDKQRMPVRSLFWYDAMGVWFRSWEFILLAPWWDLSDSNSLWLFCEFVSFR
nr:hypothetical protein [Tanacetum cinerariifolium]